jgi:hypothetical protein
VDVLECVLPQNPEIIWPRVATSGWRRHPRAFASRPQTIHSHRSDRARRDKARPEDPTVTVSDDHPPLALIAIARRIYAAGPACMSYANVTIGPWPKQKRSAMIV